MTSLPLVKSKLVPLGNSLGYTSYWIVDKRGRSLHTEPVCLVPDGWHEWFKKHIEDIDFEYWGIPDENS
jgi:hypothetical protein